MGISAARRRDGRRARRAGGARSRDARGDRPDRCGGRGAPLHQIARCRRRCDHRRPQQRLRDLRGAGDPPRLPAGARLFLRQDPGMRLVLCRAYAAKESVLGEITMDDVKVTALLPEQRCTIASVAGHAMYERANPFYEHFLGGHIDMRDCRYEQYDERTVRITGPRYVPAEEVRVKLEGAGKIGERYVGIVGVRDPYTIEHIDDVIAWARAQAKEQLGTDGWELHFTVYGRNAILGELEPLKASPAHELGIVVQAVAPTRELAEEACMIGTRQMFYARLPQVKGTAGGVAFLLDEGMPASPAYRWTISHTLRLDQPVELFPTFLTEAGI